MQQNPHCTKSKGAKSNYSRPKVDQGVDFTSTPEYVS